MLLSSFSRAIGKDARHYSTPGRARACDIALLTTFPFHSQPCTPHVVYGCILIHPDLKLKEEKGPRTTGSPKTRTLATLVLLKKGANREWIRFGLVRDASSGAEASRFKREAQALLSKSCAL